MTRYRNLSLFLVLAAVWGSAFMAIKAGLNAGFPPVLFAALRYEIAGVLMLGYAWWLLDDPLPRGRTQWAEVAVGAVLMIAAYHAFLFVGEADDYEQSADRLSEIANDLREEDEIHFVGAFHYDDQVWGVYPGPWHVNQFSAVFQF